jgi:hypothetical protein
MVLSNGIKPKRACPEFIKASDKTPKIFFIFVISSVSPENSSRILNFDEFSKKSSLICSIV